MLQQESRPAAPSAPLPPAESRVVLRRVTQRRSSITLSRAAPVDPAR